MHHEVVNAVLQQYKGAANVQCIPAGAEGICTVLLEVFGTVRTVQCQWCLGQPALGGQAGEHGSV